MGGTRLSMETMEVQYVMDSTAMKGIRITVFIERQFVNLPILYTKDIIPGFKDHIPTNGDIGEKMGRWQHQD